MLALFVNLPRRLVAAAFRGPDVASYQSVLTRLESYGLGINSLISIGAGSGGDTLELAKVWPGARSLLVEAQEAHRPDLERLKASHKTVDFALCAAAETDGSVRFGATTKTGGVVSETEGESVPARRVDTLVKEYGLAAPFALKFDTHGYELPILDGATETLKSTALIMMEVYNFKFDYVQQKNLVFHEMCAYLGAHGFRFVDLCHPLFRPGDNVLWQFHAFFVRADHPFFASNSYSGGKPLS